MGMTSNTTCTLDSVSLFRFLVWRAINQGLPLQTDGLEDCLQSYGLEVPFCELHRKNPNMRIVLNYLEALETSLMGVTG